VSAVPAPLYAASGERISRARSLAWWLWSVAMVCVAGAALLILATFSVDVPSRGFGFRGWVPIVGALWATIGARVAARQPQISVGWLILAVGCLWSVNALFEEYATFAYFPQQLDVPLVPQLVWFNNLVGATVAGLSGIALLVVPDGKLKSPRWYPLAVAVVLAALISVVILAILPRRLVPFPFDNPFGLETLRPYAPTFPAIMRALDVFRGLAVLLPAVAVVLRLRASTGVPREQLKWVAFAATYAAALVFVYAFYRDPIVQYAQLLGLALVPISFAIAMRRHRLYEIDRILDRTLVIGVATALLAGLYTASIGLMQRVFIVLTGERSDAAVVLTTLLVASAFTPLRELLQGFLKRNFGSSVPGTKGLDSFTDEVDEHLRLSDRDRLLTQLLAESVGSLGAVGGALVEAAAERPARTLGSWDGVSRLSADVRVGGEVVAQILLGPRVNAEPYGERARLRLERSTRVVGQALERLGASAPTSVSCSPS
jgi:hypothetical protein